MALQMQAFGGFTQDMFEAFAEKIKQDVGVDIQGNSCTVEHGSFTFQYSYDSAALLLHIQCLKKPFFIPASMIINGISEEVAALRAAKV